MKQGHVLPRHRNRYYYMFKIIIIIRSYKKTHTIRIEYLRTKNVIMLFKIYFKSNLSVRYPNPLMFKTSFQNRYITHQKLMLTYYFSLPLYMYFIRTSVSKA